MGIKPYSWMLTYSQLVPVINIPKPKQTLIKKVSLADFVGFN